MSEIDVTSNTYWTIGTGGNGSYTAGVGWTASLNTYYKLDLKPTATLLAALAAVGATHVKLYISFPTGLSGFCGGTAILLGPSGNLNGGAACTNPTTYTTAAADSTDPSSGVTVEYHTEDGFGCRTNGTFIVYAITYTVGGGSGGFWTDLIGTADT
jgi:hypothetical protein